MSQRFRWFPHEKCECLSVWAHLLAKSVNVSAVSLVPESECEFEYEYECEYECEYGYECEYEYECEHECECGLP